MKNNDHDPASISVPQWLRDLWALEAEHPPFVGSLKNIKFYIGIDKPKSKPRKTSRARTAARKKSRKGATPG